MSDDPNRPDPEHELEVDLRAFLPEGSRFATDDDEIDDAPDGNRDDAATGAIDGAGREADLSDRSVPVNRASAPAMDDVGGSARGAADAGDGWGTDAPAPEIPAWARDDLPPPPIVVDEGSLASDASDPQAHSRADQSTPEPAGTSSDHDADETTPSPAGASPDAEAPAEPNAGPAVAAKPEVDTTVLTRIEGELADVDAAIAAIDAGDLARSPLLAELLAADQPDQPATSNTPGTP